MRDNGFWTEWKRARKGNGVFICAQGLGKVIDMEAYLLGPNHMNLHLQSTRWSMEKQTWGKRWSVENLIKSIL